MIASNTVELCMTSINEHEGKKYLKTIDVYCVLVAFGVTCPARQHAIKKLLSAGTRGKGDEMSDLVGALAAVNRAIDLQKNKDNETKG
jgi:hypothetical protein